MNSPPARQGRSRPGILTVALLAAVTPLIATFAVSDNRGEDALEEDAWRNMEVYVSSLTTSDPQQKRDLAESAFTFLKPLFDGHPGRDEEDVSRVIDSLRRLLRTEKDDWITTRVLNDIIFRDSEALGSLFLEALKSPSPNLNWCGIRWFSDNESADALPELQKAWRHKERPWVRVDLVAALARHGSQEHLDDFIDLARGANPDLSLAAIEALATLQDVRAIPVLAKIVEEGPEDARFEALGALTGWPDDRDALDAVLRASRTEEARIRARATRSLASFPGPEAEDRLIDLALSANDDPSVRIAAIAGMDHLDSARAIIALVEILQEPAPEEDSYLHSRVISKLRDLDDPSILAALLGFVPKGDGFPSDAFSDLQAYLARDRSTHGKIVSYSTACSFSAVITDPQNPNMIAVAPPPGLLSIRCWRYPGVAGDPEDFPRLPAGTPVRIDDHFELRGESWVGVSSQDLDDCWVPMRFIEHPPAQAPGAGEEDTMLIRREFDIPASEAESDVARGLMDAGLLEVIEPGDEVIGVAITVDPENFDMVLLLARSCSLDETALDDEIGEIVQKLAPLYPEHPALDRFRRRPAADLPDTDTVIDLQMKELSDQ